MCVCVSHKVVSDTDCRPPGFSARGILQARILEWIAIPLARGTGPWSPASQTDSLPFEPEGSLFPRLRPGERPTLCHGLAAGWRTRARSQRTSKPLKAELRWNSNPGKPSAHEALDGLTLKKQNPQLKTLEESDGIVLYVCGGVCKK